jgi:hypothetical protein
LRRHRREHVRPGPAIRERLARLGGGHARQLQRVDAGTYAARHIPAVYYSALSDCAHFDVPMGDVTKLTGPFYDDARSGNLPSFSSVTPNLVDDAHNRSPAVGDAWLKKVVTFLTVSAGYQSGDTVVFITNDECCNGRVTQCCARRKNSSASVAGTRAHGEFDGLGVRPRAASAESHSVTRSGD